MFCGKSSGVFRNVDNFRSLSERRPVHLRPASVSCLKHHNQQPDASSLRFLTITVFSLSNEATWPADTGEPGRVQRWRRHVIGSAASVVCHQAFLLTLWLPCLFSATDYLPLALTSRSPIIWILPPPFPTGVVIPSPQRRLNDFILPRLSFPANDVPRSIILWCWLPESAGVWALVLLASRGGGIMREQFRGSKNLGSKKRRGWIDTKAGFFMCCQHAFLWSVRCLSETPPV